MAEVVIALKGQPFAGREPWTRSVDISEQDAKKVAEWLQKTLPDLIAQAKGGYFTQAEVTVRN